jgi:hypothetical protein
MKKIDFEKLSASGLFGSFSANKLNSKQLNSLRGGTATSLCKTTESYGDTDAQGSQENLKDSRCNGY